MSGLFDKAKKAAGENSEKLAEGVRKAAKTAKEKTGGKYDDKIDKASDAATNYLSTSEGHDEQQDGNGGGDKRS